MSENKVSTEYTFKIKCFGTGYNVTDYTRKDHLGESKFLMGYGKEIAKFLKNIAEILREGEIEVIIKSKTLL